MYNWKGLKLLFFKTIYYEYYQNLDFESKIKSLEVENKNDRHLINRDEREVEISQL